MQDPLLFSLAVLALLGTPGPTNTLLATSGALAGLRRSLRLIPAELLGYCAAIGVLHGLFGAALAASPRLSAALRLAVGLYLLLAAAQLWRRGGGPVQAGAGIGFRQVLVTTLLNPKAAVFAFAVLPLSGPAPLPYLAAFVAFVVGAALTWILAGAGLARTVPGLGPRMVSRAAAVVLTCFAGLIAAG